MGNEIRTPFHMLNWFSEFPVWVTCSLAIPVEQLSNPCTWSEEGLIQWHAGAGSQWFTRGEGHSFRNFESQLLIINIKLFKVSNKIN